MPVIHSFVPRRARRRRAARVFHLIVIALLIVWLPVAILAAFVVLAP